LIKNATSIPERGAIAMQFLTFINSVSMWRAKTEFFDFQLFYQHRLSCSPFTFPSTAQKTANAATKCILNNRHFPGSGSA